jgi:TP901 family phage tail tape measure protein
MEWDKAGSIQDKIQNTAKLGKTSFSELGNALPKVTGNAATLGVGIDELLGSFGALTGVSGNTAEVSTQLSAIFTSLVKPTSEAAEMAKNMGIQFDSLSIKKAGGVIQFFDQLKTKVTQYSAETGQNSTEIYGKLFSSAEALRAFIPLTSSVSEDFKNKTAEIANSTGVMNRAFEIMSSTTTAQFQLMRNKFGNTMDTIFTALKPLVSILMFTASAVFHLANKFTEMFPNGSKIAVMLAAVTFGAVLFANAMMFAGIKVQMMWIQTQKLGIRLLSLAGRFKVAMVSSWNFAKSMAVSAFNAAKMGAAALWTGITAIPSLVIALGTWIAVQTGLNVAMNANPIGIVILAVGALIGVVALVIKYWDTLKGYLINFGKFFLMLNPFGFMLVLIDTIFPQFRGIVSDIFDKVMGYLSKLWGNIKEIFGSIASFLGLDFDTNVNINGNTVEDEESQFSTNGSDFSIDPNSFAGNNGSVPESAGGTSETPTASSGGIKSITQTINVSQYFTLPTNWKDELENIRRSTASLISASAADGVAAL